jgi:pentose-5-phosphate-3-epimerase
MSWRDWIRTVEIEPAVDAADPAACGVQVGVLLRAGCRVFGISLDEDHAGLPVIAELSPLLRPYGGVFDVELRGDTDPRACAALAAAGADSVTFPFEQTVDLPAVVAAARAHGLQVGVSYSAASDPHTVAAHAADADLVRCPDGELALAERLEAVHTLARALPAGAVVQVAGGVDASNVRAYYEAGARVLVVGGAIFEREDLPRAYRRLVSALA